MTDTAPRRGLRVVFGSRGRAPPRRGFSRGGARAALLAVAVAVLLIPTATHLPSGVRAAPHAHAVPSTADPLARAEASLAGGVGPARGTAWDCGRASISSSAACSAAPVSTAGTTGANWVSLSVPSFRSGAAMVFDYADGYVLLFGGHGPAGYLGDTWKYAQGRWTELHPVNAPSARAGAGIAWDHADGYAVLFGGFNGKALGDTWGFVGGQWFAIPASSLNPSPRSGVAMNFDPVDGYVLLFGGNRAPGDTWKFAGGSWNPLERTVGPPARYNAGLTYDATDGHLLLFGGRNVTTGVSYGDTWNFAGGTWTQLRPSVSPPARSAPSLRFDTRDGYAVLFGGLSASSVVLGDTWSFAHGAWTHRFPALSPPARFSAAAVYDANASDAYLLLAAGCRSASCLNGTNDAWKFVAGAWSEVNAAQLAPAPRAGAMMAYDARDRYVLLFGGGGGSGCNPGGPAIGQFDCNDTWAFSGGRWRELFPYNASDPVLSSPPPREDGVMAYDAKDGYVVLFGGQDSLGNEYDDTWVFAGGHWTWLHPHAQPAARFFFALTYDTQDGYLLLFGGFDNGDTYDDTWAFVGGQWSELFPTKSPGFVQGQMVYDPLAGYVVLASQSGTWKFVAGQWSFLTGSEPPAVSEAGLIWDPTHGYAVIFGGLGCGSVCGQTWAFSGGVWTRPHPATSPPARTYVDFAYDTADRYGVQFGGQTYTGTNFGDTWAFT